MTLFHPNRNTYLRKSILFLEQTDKPAFKSFSGNSSYIQSQLKNVKMIVPSRTAFAALLGDGSVVVWGNENFDNGCNIFEPI